MFSKHPGIFTAMTGILALAIGAVVLARVVRARTAASATTTELARQTAAASLDIDQLKLVLERTRGRWQALQRHRNHQSRLALLTRQCADLRTLAQGQRSSLAALDLEFRNYRNQWRTQIRNHAIGEKFPQLTTRDGRVFHQVSITRVTDAGLDIHHAHGSARLNPLDLPAPLQQRFAWFDDSPQSPPDQATSPPPDPPSPNP